MKIIAAGDLFVADPFRGKDLFDPSVKNLFAAADHRMVNLEAPITAGAKGDRILKTGPHLAMPRETALPVLRQLGADLVTLANNHILDFGRAGLAETLEVLNEAGIRAVGAGLDLAGAARPCVLEKAGASVTVLNFAENEWASAGPASPGANPLDAIENARQIREARRTSDHVLVVIHGGQEDYHYPTPRMVKQYRFYAESGASAIVGHHPHCIGGYEVHGGCPIFYSLGNFLFTQTSEFERWYTGLVLTLDVERGRGISWELTPVAQSKDDGSLACLTGEGREKVLREVGEYSRVIADEALLAERWDGFLAAFESYYLNVFNPLGVIRSDRVKMALIKLGLDRWFITRSHFAMILNTIRCESHIEAAKDVLERHLK
jgi:poly-gamma-glutamate synthesis protein (capsule biosynthesis protein)